MRHITFHKMLLKSKYQKSQNDDIDYNTMYSKEFLSNLQTIQTLTHLVTKWKITETISIEIQHNTLLGNKKILINNNEVYNCKCKLIEFGHEIEIDYDNKIYYIQILDTFCGVKHNVYTYITHNV